MGHITKLLVFAVAYYIAGRAGLLVTVPPGQAAAIWPASGIALAGLLVLGRSYWPAIFIGALGTSLYHPTVIDLSAVMVAVFIAIGATVQALAGAWLVRRILAFPNVLEKVSDVLEIIFYGGVIACIISASISTATLHYAGLVLSDTLVSHWIVWWVGDVLGVVIFAPAAILLLAQNSLKVPLSASRKWIVVTSLLIVFVIVAFLFTLAQEKNKQEIEAAYTLKVNDLTFGIREVLQSYLTVLVANQQFIESSDHVSDEEFQHFTRRFLDTIPGIHGLSWNPKVTHEQRNEYVNNIREQGYPDFVIKDRVGLGETQPAADRAVYFPVGYAVPYEANKAAHGFDTYGLDAVSKNLRHDLLNAARDQAKAITTGRILLVQEEDRYGLLIYHPVYQRALKSQQIEDRRKHLLGYTVAVLIIPEMMKVIKEHASELGMDVLLYDRSSPVERQFLYDSRTPDNKESEEERYKNNRELTQTRTFDFAAHQWELMFIEDRQRAGQHDWTLWTILVAGLLFTGLFSMFILSVTARTDVVQRLVDEKTAELTQANSELEEFAYRTSHDLRSPLLSSLRLLDVAKKDILSDQKDKATEIIHIVKKSLVQLEALVSDILQLTKTKNNEEQTQTIDVSDVIHNAIQKLSYMEGFDHVNIETDLRFDRTLLSKQDRVVLIVENLISNAIKYQDKNNADSLIRITSYEDSNTFFLEVFDNGLGIPENQRKNLFAMFKRFHPKTAFGSGLGLYMIKKSADVIGGEIAYVDIEQGTLFRLTVPIRKA